MFPLSEQLVQVRRRAWVGSVAELYQDLAGLGIEPQLLAGIALAQKAGSPSRYHVLTGHVLNRGTIHRGMSPQFDDLRPLDLQEPKERGRPLESAGDPKPTYASNHN